MSEDLPEEKHKPIAEPALDQDDPEGSAPEASAADAADDGAAERARLKDQLLRTAADFDNFRKRSKKELEQAVACAREDTIRELLPVFDNLERAVEAAASAADVEAVRSGVTMVLKQFEDIGGRLGLERIVSEGERFDPNVHDAFQQQETDDAPPGTVLKEYQPGYRLGERLLRPAMVVVARKPSAPEGDG